MATITFTIPDNELPTIIGDLCEHFGYQEQIPNVNGSGTVPNPESRAQFAKRMMAGKIRETINQIRTIRHQREAPSLSDATIN